MNASEPAATIEKLVGVYDANGSLAGELAYWFGARFGVRHCSLCDITHGTFRAKPEWQQQADQLPVEFAAVHLDERAPAVAEASIGHEPCVVALRTDGSTDVVINSGQLDGCSGDPGSLTGLLNELFSWPSPWRR